MTRPRWRLWRVCLVLSLASVACSVDGEKPASEQSRHYEATPRSADEICRAGMPWTPFRPTRVERAIAAPLASVKSWVLASDRSIEWSSFSRSLAEAPSTEKVGICVYTKLDGSHFRPPPGIGPQEPIESVMLIVRKNGDATLFLMGTKAELLESTPESLRRRR